MIPVQIDIIKLAEIIGACSVVLGVVWGLFNYNNKMLDHISDLERRMTALEKELERMKKEDTLVIYALRACLDGLKQQGCNGRVTDACDMLDKHINKAAHDQD